MTERSAEQAPVQSRPDTQDPTQDTARIPLAERLQRRIAASDERRASGQTSRKSGRVLPPPPPELAQQSARPAERTSTTTNGWPGPTSEAAPVTGTAMPPMRAAMAEVALKPRMPRPPQPHRCVLRLILRLAFLM